MLPQASHGLAHRAVVRLVHLAGLHPCDKERPSRSPTRERFWLSFLAVAIHMTLSLFMNFLFCLCIVNLRLKQALAHRAGKSGPLKAASFRSPDLLGPCITQKKPFPFHPPVFFSLGQFCSLPLLHFPWVWSEQDFTEAPI